ncbi:MAG TPA: hypothetical protein VK249_11390, partial [Anaerolineales bacterium]|nr:hypothetical protein [Anaerolineales bacterium]
SILRKEIMSTTTCLNCGASELDRPLLLLKFQQREFYICPQCLPVLIHKPYELAEKLPDFKPSDHPSNQDE